MHVAKHVHGLIPNSLEAKHVNTHVKSRYTCRSRPHPKATFHRTRNKCKREYVLPEAGSDDTEIRDIKWHTLNLVSGSWDMIFLCQVDSTD